MTDWFSELRNQAPWIIALCSGVGYVARWLAVNVISPLTLKHIEYLEFTSKQFIRHAETLYAVQACLNQLAEQHKDMVEHHRDQVEACRDQAPTCPLRELDAMQLARISHAEMKSRVEKEEAEVEAEAELNSGSSRRRKA